MIETKDQNINIIQNQSLLRNKFLQDKISNCTFNKIDAGFMNKNPYDMACLAYIYTLSGISSIDVPAFPEIIDETKKAIAKAICKAERLGLKIEDKPLLIASIKSSLFCEDFENVFKSKLDQLLDSGTEAFELHIDRVDLNLIKHQMNIIKFYSPNKIISISISRKRLSNANVIELIKSAYQILNKELIIEVNECVEKNSNESSHSILQTISTADIINKQLKLKEIKLRKLPIILAAGNSLFISKLADQCGVPFNGITFEHDDKELNLYSRKRYFDFSDQEIVLAVEKVQDILRKSCT